MLPNKKRVTKRTALIIFFWNSSQLSVEFWDCRLLWDCGLTVDCNHRHVGSHLLQGQCTMLRRPEPTKERVERTILSIIAIEIRHLTRFALLLQQRILRYMWCNHVTTWTKANNSGRNLDLNKIRFLYLHYILQYGFWFGFESEKLESLYWYLEKIQGHSIGLLTWSRYANTALHQDKVSYIVPCWLLTESKVSSLPQWNLGKLDP